MSYNIAFTNEVELLSDGRRDSNSTASKPRSLSQHDDVLSDVYPEYRETLSSRRVSNSLASQV